ncbi:hypothetical protein KFK09_003285 [Dendrobium nobile]|uniref:Uncharacterized protein n=1 Tax=Dendrobium nobile TaxID=94219 RepID=A0A8T3C8K5_DENNO|nr:hypothetical protein KFK09_003285 [Dendrobium nobile]
MIPSTHLELLIFFFFPPLSFCGSFFSLHKQINQTYPKKKEKEMAKKPRKFSRTLHSKSDEEQVMYFPFFSTLYLKHLQTRAEKSKFFCKILEEKSKPRGKRKEIKHYIQMIASILYSYASLSHSFCLVSV